MKHLQEDFEGNAYAQMAVEVPIQKIYDAYYAFLVGHGAVPRSNRDVFVKERWQDIL